MRKRARSVLELVARYVHLVSLGLGELFKATKVGPVPDHKEEVFDRIFLVNDKVLEFSKAAVQIAV